MKLIAHSIIILLLTILTQIGGIVWLLNYLCFYLIKYKTQFLKKFFSFLVIYIAFTLLIIPHTASYTGRVALPMHKNGTLIPHNYITVLLNRQYVKPELKSELLIIAEKIQEENKAIKLSYLDANFPFIDGFPLLPHLSHNDGKKVDLSFYYSKDGVLGNMKPTKSGYGAFEEPKAGETNQTDICIKKGHWQYDYSKYLSLGSRSDLEFDSSQTKKLLQEILKRSRTEKIFLEPHLKSRMKLNNQKIRFQGCHSVRHDDHIHYQIH